MKFAVQIDVQPGHIVEDESDTPKHPDWWMRCDGQEIHHAKHTDLYVKMREQSDKAEQYAPNIPPREETDEHGNKRILYSYIAIKPIKINSIIEVEL